MHNKVAHCYCQVSSTSGKWDDKILQMNRRKTRAKNVPTACERHNSTCIIKRHASTSECGTFRLTKVAVQQYQNFNFTSKIPKTLKVFFSKLITKEPLCKVWQIDLLLYIQHKVSGYLWHQDICPLHGFSLYVALHTETFYRIQTIVLYLVYGQSFPWTFVPPRFCRGDKSSPIDFAGGGKVPPLILQFFIFTVS